MADTSPEQPPTEFNGPSVKDNGLPDGQQTNGVNGMGSPDLADAMNHVNINDEYIPQSFLLCQPDGQTVGIHPFQAKIIVIHRPLRSGRFCDSQTLQEATGNVTNTVITQERHILANSPSDNVGLNNTELP
uniref:Uncharacterized protein n=1 Tax=Branchiostoma floridae TaxID=7739 RepID=C3YK86_BRAFL|eukprot:XP_002603236.1 hypothetical protein BRAFLDRAFT_93296 [Branchiostoma floridae]